MKSYVHQDPEEKKESGAPSLAIEAVIESPLTRILKDIYGRQKTLPKIIDIESVHPLPSEAYVLPEMTITDGKNQQLHIKIEEIFSLIDKFHPEAGQILAEGDIGAGKTTTFLWELPHNWATKGRFADKFDQMFIVKLDLIFKWIASEEDRSLEKFISYLVDLYKSETPLTAERNTKREGLKRGATKTLDLVTDALYNGQADRILFLLDGYSDAMNHIARNKRSQENQIALELINSIFNFPYVIATARLGELPPLVRNKFDRIIQVNGFNLPAIKLYITNFFLSQQNSLVNHINSFQEDESGAQSIKDQLLSYFRSSANSEIYTLHSQLSKIVGESSPATKDLIIEYIEQYYGGAKDLVIALIKQYPTIKEIVSNPINLVMLCLVCSDLTEQAKATLTVGKLYREFVIWLAKRYIARFTEDTPDEEVFLSKEFLVLQQIAYESYISNAPVDGKTIYNIATKLDLTLEDVRHFGLLRSIDSLNSDASDIHKTYIFENLSVRNYLAAHAFKTMLMSQNKEDYEKASIFIASHRNQPLYQEMLKFLVELLGVLYEAQPERPKSLLPSFITKPISSPPSLAQQAFLRFWEAITCNVEGMIEIGVSKKITLLMSLIAQIKRIDGLTNKIPNYEQTVKIIDQAVLENFSVYAESIKTSGYISDSIKLYLASIVKNIEGLSTSRSFIPRGAINLTLQESIDIMVTLSDHLDTRQVYEIIEPLLKFSLDAQIKRSIIKLIVKLRNGADLANILARYIENNELRDPIIYHLKNLINDENFQDERSDIVDIILGNGLKINTPAKIELLIHIFGVPGIDSSKIVDAILSTDNIADFLLSLRSYNNEQIVNVILEQMVVLQNKKEVLYVLRKGDDYMVNHVLSIMKSSDFIGVRDLLLFIKETKNKIEPEVASLMLGRLLQAQVDPESDSDLTIALIKLIMLLSGNPKYREIKKEAVSKIHRSLIPSLVINIDSQKLQTLYYVSKIETVANHMVTQGKDRAIEVLLQVLAQPQSDNEMRRMALVIISSLSPSEEILKSLQVNLLNLLLSSKDYHEIIDTICSASVNNFEFKQGMFKVLIDMLYQEEGRLTYSARIVEALNKISAAYPSLRTVSNDSPSSMSDTAIDNSLKDSRIEEVIKLLIESLELSTTDGDIKIIVNAISNLVMLKVDLIDSVLIRLRGFIDKPAMAGLVIYAIGKILKKIDYKDIPSDILALIKSTLLSENIIIKSASIYALSKLLASSEFNLITIDEFLILLESLPKNIDQRLLNNIVFIIKSFLNKSLVTDNSVVDHLASFLNETRDSHTIVVIDALHEVIKKSRLYNLILLIDHPKLTVQDLAVSRLLDKFTNIADKTVSTPGRSRSLVLSSSLSEFNSHSSTSIEATFVQKIQELFAIVTKCKVCVDNDKRQKLYKVSNKLLTELVLSIDETGLEEVVNFFEQLVADYNREEVIRIMKLIFHYTLSDRKITELECKYILKCIHTLGFTFDITMPTKKEGQVTFSITFDGRLYNFVSETDQDSKRVQSIVTAILMESGNNNNLTRKYLQQYTTHTPLFHNTGSGIPIAAFDIPSCKSLVDKKELSSEPKCSVLYLSDEHKSSIQNFFILIERRPISGHRVTTKIFISPDRTIKIATTINQPNEDLASIRKRVFGEMTYSAIKPKYFGLTFSIPSDKIEDLYNSLLIGSVHSVVNHEVVSLEIESPSLKVESITFDSGLGDEEDEKRSDFDFDPLTLKRQESYISITGEACTNEETSQILVERFISELKKLGIKFPKKLVKEGVVNLGSFTKYNRAELLEIDAKQEARESMMADQFELIQGIYVNTAEIKSRLSNIDFDLLEDVTKQTKLKRDESAEISAIEADDYASAFYHALIWNLNGVYVAASSISSGMVANDKKGDLGNIAGWLDTVSNYTPVAGFGFYIISEVLSGIDDAQQSEKLTRYVRVAADSIKMAKLAERLARKLVKDLVKLKIEIKEKSTELNTVSGMMSAAGEVASSALGLSISGVASSAYSAIRQRASYIKDLRKSKNKPEKLLDYAERFIKGRSESAESKGEVDAEIIAKIIVAKLFTGEFNARQHTQEKVDSLIGAVLDELRSRATLLTQEHSSNAVSSATVSAAAVNTAEVVPRAGSHRCIICAVPRVEYTSPILASGLLSEMRKYPEIAGNLLNLSSEQQQIVVDKIRADGLEKALAPFIEENKKLKSFLNEAKQYLTEGRMILLEEMLSNVEISDLNQQDILNILSALFNVDISQLMAEKLLEQDKQNMENSEVLAEIIEAPSEGLLNHFMAALRNSKTSQALINKMVEVYKYLETAYLNHDHGDRVIAAELLFGDLLNFAGSNVHGALPFYGGGGGGGYDDPGYGGGSGSSGGGVGQPSNNSLDSSIPIAVYWGQVNITIPPYDM